MLDKNMNVSQSGLCNSDLLWALEKLAEDKLLLQPDSSGLFPPPDACCFCVLVGDVGARSDSPPAPTQAPLSLKCLRGEWGGCRADLSASWARWRWVDGVTACCYSAHFISSFSLWFLFLGCEDGKSLASRLKQHWQKKKERERERETQCECVRELLTSTTSASE